MKNYILVALASALLVLGITYVWPHGAHSQTAWIPTSGVGPPSSCPLGSQYENTTTGDMWEAVGGACAIFALGQGTVANTTDTWTGSTHAWGGPFEAAALKGTTGSIGGGLLTVGSCTSGTATVTGATVGMTATQPTPTDGTNLAGLGAGTYATVTASNTVTVNVCALVALTPPSKQYNVAVIP